MEGSSWRAFEARDMIRVGGDAHVEGIEYTFGCQYYETDLFRDQLENGIMGLSRDSATLLAKLSGEQST